MHPHLDDEIQYNIHSGIAGDLLHCCCPSLKVVPYLSLILLKGVAPSMRRGMMRERPRITLVSTNKTINSENRANFQDSVYRTRDIPHSCDCE